MQTFHNIDGVDIPFNAEWTNVAISVSGGADSALLAYLVCDLADHQGRDVTVHIITHVRTWKTHPWDQHHADQVYEWLFKKFYYLEFIRHTNFIAPDIEYGITGPNLTDEYGKKVSGDNIQQRAYAEFICHKYDIDAYYNAVTRNPSQVQLGGMPERDLEPTEENKYLEYMIHMGCVASHPFRFVDKSWVLKQYKRLGIMDLFDTTRSCDSEFSGIDYKTYEAGQYIPTCGKCFYCKERAWAIENS
jgi:hypothetical protein